MAGAWRAIKNTARVKWTGVPGEMPGRDDFVKQFVLEKFRLTETEVLGIQQNRREQFVDVAFRGPTPFTAFLERCKTEELGSYRVESLEHRNHRVVIVNFFDMNLPDQSVSQFLERYARVVSGPKMKRDAFGFWTGQRVYEVLLKESDHGFEGYLHPPALCMVEGVKGYVVYSRQPPFCRRCMEVGHADADCGRVVCHNCRQRGHIAAECKEARACNICSSTDHLMRSCPNRQRTYADAAREGAEQRPQQKPTEQTEEPGAGEASAGEPQAGAESTPGPAEAEGPTADPAAAEETALPGSNQEPVPDSAGPIEQGGPVPDTRPELGKLEGMDTAEEGSTSSESEEPMVQVACRRKRGQKRKGRPEKAAAEEKPVKAKAKTTGKIKDWAEEVEREESDSPKPSGPTKGPEVEGMVFGQR